MGELRQAKALEVDLKARKDKTALKSIKGLHERCANELKSSVDERLVQISDGDPDVWEVVPIKGKKTPQGPQPPKMPKNCVDPAKMFKDDPKESKKYESYDEEGNIGMPLTKVGAKDLT